MGEFPSGQRGQTVNLLRFASMVRIRPPPPGCHLSVPSPSTGSKPKVNMGEFPSGQRGQTVNLLRFASMVRIRPPPPKVQFERTGLFAFRKRIVGRIRKAALGKCPVDTCNRRGFAAAKRIRPTSSGKAEWANSISLLRKQKLHASVRKHFTAVKLQFH